MTDRNGNSPARREDASAHEKARKMEYPSNRGFFIFMTCCAIGAVLMVALLVTGGIQGERVAPDIAPKAKNVD